MHKARILLIDDEIELVSTLVERLEIRGIEADAVTTGHDALELMSEKKFSLVVVDLKMPGLSGIEVMKVIEEKHPGVKVILITGHGTDSPEMEGVPAGVFDVLLKPFTIDNLLDRIREALADQPGGENQSE